MKLAKENLIRDFPLMKCGNKTEFQQRLQWLSEGMLENHIKSVIAYVPNQVEIAAYRKYKEEIKLLWLDVVTKCLQ